jgi:hypothetical protein
VQGIAANVASVGAFLLGLIFQVLTIGLFTFYLVADGPRFRRGVCSLLPPRIQRDLLAAWEVAIDKTGGYLYSRLLLAIINATFSFIALQALGIPFAAPLALWQGFVSQFIPVVGTYIAAAVPLLVALLEDPWKALWFLIFVIVYQQIENYLLAPRITAKTMQLHPAVAFGAALAGGSIGGLLGAFMALPAAAVIQSTISTYLKRHEVVETQLTREDDVVIEQRQRCRGRPAHGGRDVRPYLRPMAATASLRASASGVRSRLVRTRDTATATDRDEVQLAGQPLDGGEHPGHRVRRREVTVADGGERDETEVREVHRLRLVGLDEERLVAHDGDRDVRRGERHPDQQVHAEQPDDGPGAHERLHHDATAERDDRGRGQDEVDDGGHGLGRPRIAEPSGDAEDHGERHQDDRDAPRAPPDSGGEEREQHDAALHEDRRDLQPGRVRGREDEREQDEQEQQTVAIGPARLLGGEGVVGTFVFALHARTVLRPPRPSREVGFDNAISNGYSWPR